MACVRNERKIYVANISRHATEKDIGSLFEGCGRIASLEHKGNFGFIEFESEDSAASATRYCKLIVFCLSLFYRRHRTLHRLFVVLEDITHCESSL